MGINEPDPIEDLREVECAEAALALLQRYLPNIKTTLATNIGEHPIIFYENGENEFKNVEILNFLGLKIFSYPSKQIDDPECKEFFKGGTYKDLCAHGQNAIKGGIEIATSDGNVIYIMPASARDGIKAQNGVRKRGEKVEKLSKKWLTKNANAKDIEMQKRAVKVLCGESWYKAIMLVLAGINAANYSRRTDIYAESVEADDFLDYIASIMPGIKKVFHKTHVISRNFLGQNLLKTIPKNVVFYESVFYNEHAVSGVTRGNADIFESCGVGEGDVDGAVGEILNKSDARNSANIGTDNDKGLGLLLGYDRESVLNYSSFVQQPQPDFNFSIWSDGYVVHDYQNNSDFKALKAKHDALLVRVEALLEQGLGPLDVLKTIHAESFFKN
ncbi:MAG: hypothetical protein US89_C0011G0025 [Candidatus Peregrinibacteria bacterium GW2011_GWF2_38_29]|nr:MAG: hypothetical protein US89_C0011G0025 [Candidatus Peregrinibacteria bacterium GW2011_GWF2_38_29]HBB02313.1 hypothetical protein [Candidatus Peregrinibacteria bacterium]